MKSNRDRLEIQQNLNVIGFCNNYCSKVIPSVIFVFLVLCVLLLQIIGCNTPEIAMQPDVFEVILGADKGRSISLQGDSTGYQPGRKYDFTVAIQNDDSETWDEHYCLLLIDETGVQAQLGEATFNLSPTTRLKDIITTTLPTQLRESGYGISLVISDGEAVTGVIWVGEPADRTVNLSVNPRECSVGPLGISEFSINRE